MSTRNRAAVGGADAPAYFEERYLRLRDEHEQLKRAYAENQQRLKEYVPSRRRGLLPQ